jgi:hypothetical protein
MKSTLRRVRVTDDTCYAKATASYASFCDGTIYGSIKDGAESIGLVPYRPQFYTGGCTTLHQDSRAYESEIFVKIRGFFEMKRSLSTANNNFLVIGRQCGAVCVNTTGAFHVSPTNPYYHMGGGEDAVTVIFRSLDGKRVTKDQSVLLMSFFYSLDCKLEADFQETRMLSALMSALRSTPSVQDARG